MKESKGKIIFHYLPPAKVEMPSPAFSILKSFLNRYDYEVEVIYWNIFLEEIFSSYSDDYFNYKNEYAEAENLELIPFLSFISDRFQDESSTKRIDAYLERAFPKYRVQPGGCSLVLEELKSNFLHMVDSVLENRPMKDVILFGFSSKFHQWIPGMILAEQLKSRFPQVKTVIGGFGNKDAGLAVLKACQQYDFAIWGEGEYPLLQLSELLREGIGDFKRVPRLIFRLGSALECTHESSEYLDLQSGLLPDYQDFFDLVKNKNHSTEISALPIESKRGCHWNRCKFCFLNAGYKYRVRSPENIVKEIETLFKSYEITDFYFLCNDIVGRDIVRFENLLDRIIDLSTSLQVTFNFHSEIVHYGFNARIIKKLAIAGFSQSQIGYEAICDQLLKKIDKRTGFADHLLFLKFSRKAGIIPSGANIMRGIIGETEDDVLQSIKNLHFLRFFISREEPVFLHNIRQLRLQGSTRFFHLVDNEERKKWNFNFITHLLPGPFIEEDQRFDLFDYTKPLEHKVAWEWFEQVNQFYEETEFNYRILAYNDIPHYYEYMNGEQIDHTIFDEPEYWEVLKTANHEVISFDNIWNKIHDSYPQALTKGKLSDVIRDLKSAYLLYANDDLSQIISIIDTDSGFQ